MSSDDDYSDDDFEEDFDDLTKTGVPATASAVEESTDDLDGSVNCGLTDSCCKLNTPEKDDHDLMQSLWELHKIEIL